MWAKVPVKHTEYTGFPSSLSQPTGALHGSPSPSLSIDLFLNLSSGKADRYHARWLRLRLRLLGVML